MDRAEPGEGAMPEPGLLGIALLGAVAFGSGDMAGACATRRMATANVVVVSQVAAIIFLSLMAKEMAVDLTGRAAVMALAGGATYAVGLLLLYRGLAIGRVGVVAPLCAMFSILASLAGDLVQARVLTSSQIAGVALCALAAMLITAAPRDGGTARIWWSARIGAASGLVYGGADVLLASAPDPDSGSVVLMSRWASVGLAMAIALRASRAVAPGAPGTAMGAMPQSSGGLAVGRPMSLAFGTALAAAAGMFDVIGQVAFVHAAARGSISVASAATALFPAVTVALAVILFRERVVPLQALGYGVAASGVVLLST